MVSRRVMVIRGDNKKGWRTSWCSKDRISDFAESDKTGDMHFAARGFRCRSRKQLGVLGAVKKALVQYLSEYVFAHSQHGIPSTGRILDPSKSNASSSACVSVYCDLKNESHGWAWRLLRYHLFMAWWM